jgi:energy-converting hydrogenase A subunit P
MSLIFDATLCVRVGSKASGCEQCVTICPVQTIQIVENLPTFVPSECVGCGGCVGSCPTEAFRLSDFSTMEFFFGLLKESSPLVSCKTNIPCIATLSTEHLISLALASDEAITLDLSHCESCPTREPLAKKIESNIEEANFILSSFSDKSLVTRTDIVEMTPIEDEPSEGLSRRSLFTLKGAMQHKRSFEEAVEADERFLSSLSDLDISKIKAKHIPDKRKILYTTLKRTPKPKQYEVIPEGEITFASQKYISSACTNCQICYRICPSGALSSDYKSSFIHFDAMLCLKCHLCHDVCEPNAIHLQEGFEIKEFFEPTQRTLVQFDIKRCDECGGYFTYRGTGMTCLRCSIEEEEALTLHQNAKEGRLS